MKDWRITNISLRPADSPRLQPSPRKEYKHDPNCKAVTSPFFSDLLKNKVYYLENNNVEDDLNINMLISIDAIFPRNSFDAFHSS